MSCRCHLFFLSVVLLLTGCDDSLKTAYEGEPCDLGRQNCEEGLTCDSGISEALCRRVVNSPDPIGATCVEADFAEPSPCAVGSTCLVMDDGTPGRCVEYCDSDDDCSTGLCAGYNLCLESCDPLDPTTCSPDEACSPMPRYESSEAFCIPGTDAKTVGDDCFIACTPGLACVFESVLGCTTGLISGCCTTYCDPLDSGASAACPDAMSGQVCVDQGGGFGVCRQP